MDEFLVVLDGLVHKRTIQGELENAAERASRRLEKQPSELFAWEVLPVSLFGPALPPVYQSAWLFVIRANMPPEHHRHPNSRQVTMSYRGKGDLQTWDGEKWIANPLTSNKNASVEHRWVSIAPNTWHRPVVSSEWVVVSFHTAAEKDLIEESGEQLHQRLYSR